MRFCGGGLGTCFPMSGCRINGAFANAAPIEKQMPVIIAACVLVASASNPNNQGARAIPKFIDALFKPCTNPILSSGAIASNIGPVVSCENTVNGNPAYITNTKKPNDKFVAGNAAPIMSRRPVTIAVHELPKTQTPATPSFSKNQGVI
mmetsp:Transcript_12678/g.19526  ORF Transcript_12678/g.19526 Transcript_12678/m.19526 type:complete len:149 (+) Transcript_12678:721-1167(+)